MLTATQVAAIPGIVNESTATSVASRELQAMDERIARLERERGQWPPREWDERMRDLQRQRHLLDAMHDSAQRQQALFPVAHGQ